MAAPPLLHELDVATRLAREAGRILLEVYATDFGVEHKAHGAGPVTEADTRANAFLVDGLRRAFPGDGVVAEETADTSDARRHARCWFVDPLDGTREFVDRNGMFAVHVGLAIDAEAALGVVYLPATERLYAGVVGGACHLEDADGRREVRVRQVVAPADWTLVVSRSHKSQRTEEIRGALGVTRVEEWGSVGIKCGRLAEGSADLYLHPSAHSYRWDSCAPEAVLRAAGGSLTDFAGNRYRYDGTELRNVRGLLGCTAAALPVVLPVAQRVAQQTGLLT